MKQRIKSAIIALIISIPLVYLGGLYFKIYGLLIAFLGYREISNLFSKSNYSKIIGYLSFLTIILSNAFKTNFNNLLDYQLIGIVLILFAFVSLYESEDKNFDFNKSIAFMGMTIILGVAFSSLIIIRNISLSHFIYLFLISIFTDTFAQTTGILIGKNKMTSISPNKTWEGFIGGTFFGVLASSLFYLILVNNDINILLLLAITSFLSVIGQMGDIFFSLMKRKYKIKDFSNIMPGHGGIMDRLDSILFIILTFLFFINIL